jgi:hypothetical protein
MTLVYGSMHCRVRTWLGDIARLEVGHHSISTVKVRWVTVLSLFESSKRKS